MVSYNDTSGAYKHAAFWSSSHDSCGRSSCEHLDLRLRAVSHKLGLKVEGLGCVLPKPYHLGNLGSVYVF